MRNVKLSALAKSYLVVVNIQIIWRRKDGDQRGKARYLILAIHAIAAIEYNKILNVLHLSQLAPSPASTLTPHPVPRVLAL